MSALSTIRFDALARADLGAAVEIVPVLNGIPLTNLIHAFDQEHGFETREISYGGLIPAHFNFGPLDQLFLGQGSGREPGAKTPLLGCECGEWGCWPLLARVVVTDSTVVWSDFEQPFRKKRDYSAFGPFQFDRRDYERAVAQANEVPE